MRTSHLTKEQLEEAAALAEKCEECAIPREALLELIRLAMIGLQFEEYQQ